MSALDMWTFRPRASGETVPDPSRLAEDALNRLLVLEKAIPLRPAILRPPDQHRAGPSSSKKGTRPLRRAADV
jgi:hypothetical protein